MKLDAGARGLLWGLACSAVLWFLLLLLLSTLAPGWCPGQALAQP